VERDDLTSNAKGLTLVSMRRPVPLTVTLRVYAIFLAFNRLLLRIVALRRARELPFDSS